MNKTETSSSHGAYGSVEKVAIKHILTQGNVLFQTGILVKEKSRVP